MIGLVDGNNFYVSCERVFNRKLLGKPVAVLSNNDGCCVAMSPEFKALGIPRGTPYFQLKHREKTDGLVFLSSNYELYGDLSRRVQEVLRTEVVDVEQYSIDEAFVYPPSWAEKDLASFGRRLRQKVYRWVGIPCGVGFAPTKTLAKIANHIGKKRPDGVFVMPEDPTPVLADLSAGEVWGVGRRLPAKLRAERIHTALDLRDAPDDVLRSVGGVTLVRTAAELRGVSCNQDRTYDADPDSVSCSRCFGEPVTTRAGIVESVASFTAQAATKLRKHRLLASGCNVYVQVASPGMFESWNDIDSSFVGRTVVFPNPTDATNEMLEAVTPVAEALFVEGCRYRKAGVVFFGLEKAGSARQLDLFTETKPLESSKLYAAIDALNARYGKGTLVSASQGLATVEPSWKMRREHLSRRASTNWSELMTVR